MDALTAGRWIFGPSWHGIAPYRMLASLLWMRSRHHDFKTGALLGKTSV